MTAPGRIRPRFDRQWSVAAATLGFAPVTESLTTAIDAGYRFAGVRLDLESPSRGDITEARCLMAENDIAVFDVEVAIVGAGGDTGLHERLVDWAAELGARHLLCVGEGDDRGAIIDQLTTLAARAADVGVRPALEWMPFRSVATLQDAISIRDHVGADGIGLVVDALHLARSGGSPTDLQRLEPGNIAYVQLCDAPFRAPDDLTTEARTRRLAPGSGELPLGALLAAAAHAPVSIEVPNHTCSAPHARAVRLAAQNLIEGDRSKDVNQ